MWLLERRLLEPLDLLLMVVRLVAHSDFLLSDFSSQLAVHKGDPAACVNQRTAASLLSQQVQLAEVVLGTVQPSLRRIGQPVQSQFKASFVCSDAALESARMCFVIASDKM